MTSQFADMKSHSNFVYTDVSLVKFSYWSKFNINIATGSRVVIIFVYKGLTRNPESEKTSSVFPNIWRLGQVWQCL